MVKLNVGALLNNKQGTEEKILLETQIKFGGLDDVVLREPFSAEIYLLRLAHEINVQMHQGHTVCEARCSRCLEAFDLPVEIDFAEREFITDLPKDQMEEGEESFFLDKSGNTIDITDMIREEILLHFPPIPVCSRICKGLCDRCGANLNKGSCSCPPKEDTSNPFKALIS